MKKLLILSLVLSATTTFSQTNTEVYLLDIKEADGKIEFSNLRNISNNEGYDNQPSFYDDNSVLFSSTRNGQTDIVKYDIHSMEMNWISNTPSGSEYSPFRIPNSDDISAIRLDTNGLQRLYRYDTSTGKSQALLTNLKVGYHTWSDKDILISTVLVDEGMDLVVSNLKDGSNRIIQKGIGRSLHKIPDSDLFSFIKLEDDPISIKSLDPITGVTEIIIPIMSTISDICWLSDGTVLAGDGNSISKFNPTTDEKWEMIWRFKEKEIYQISRMAVSPNGKHLAIVSEESPATIVQKQVESFNSENLEAFAGCYAENVVVQNFPIDTLYVGNKTLKANYKRYFENSPKTTVEVVKRIQIGNVVIDEELVYRSGRTKRQAAIYEVINGKIASMTFIHENKPITNVEDIVKEQLEAYNAHDIEAFLDTYSEDIKLYKYPNKLTDEGKDALGKGYKGFLENTPDLNCEIKNRMIIGNKVLDELYLTINGNNLSAVAIYQVENGKIAKVTFLR